MSIHAVGATPRFAHSTKLLKALGYPSDGSNSVSNLLSFACPEGLSSQRLLSSQAGSMGIRDFIIGVVVSCEAAVD